MRNRNPYRLLGRGGIQKPEKCTLLECRKHETAPGWPRYRGGMAELSVLDPRFPIRFSMPESGFWEMHQQRPHRHCMDALVTRARADAARWQERYVTPITPEVAWADAQEQDSREDTCSIPVVAAETVAEPDDTAARIASIDAIWKENGTRAHAGEPRGDGPARRLAQRVLAVAGRLH